MKKSDDLSLPKWKTPIGRYDVDGYNLSAVIQKVSNDGMAGTWVKICDCPGDNWKQNARLIADLLEANRTK